MLVGDAKARQEQLETAEAAFAELSKEYNKRLVGFEARFYQGRCFEELGDLREAISFYSPFFDQSELPLSISAKPVSRAIACWTDPRIGETEKAISAGEDWLSKTKPDRDSPEAAPVRLALAKAYQMALTDSPQNARRYEQSMRDLLLAASSVVGATSNRVADLAGSTVPRNFRRCGSFCVAELR